MFIIDFLITLPLRIFVYLFFPDTPETSEAFFLTTEEKDLAVARLNRDGSSFHQHGELGMTIFKRVLGSWEIYVVSTTSNFLDGLKINQL